MKKVVSLFAMLILSVGSILAQTNYRSVKGYVIDKNGNPIPGAEVTTPGGGESVITDSDGSFNINVHPLLKKLTASYDGMGTKTLKITPDKELVFTLKNETKHPAFLNAILGYSYTKNINTISLGLMSGMIGKWGFYGKGFWDYNDSFSVTAGVVKSIFHRTIFIYAGIGYGMKYVEYPYLYNDRFSSWYTYGCDYRPGISSDFGFIFKTGSHFNLTIGYNLISTFPFNGYNYNNGSHDISVGPNYAHGLQIGLGYVF